MLIGTLVTVGFINTMTASWGTMGYYKSPVVTIFVRPERHIPIVEQETLYTHIPRRGTSHSVQEDGDTLGTTATRLPGWDSHRHSPSGQPTFEETTLVLECKKIYAQKMSENCHRKECCKVVWQGHGGDRIYELLSRLLD